MSTITERKTVLRIDSLTIRFLIVNKQVEKRGTVLGIECYCNYYLILFFISRDSVIVELGVGVIEGWSEVIVGEENGLNIMDLASIYIM